ncbi:MAG: hypothetical protein HY368_01305 [Candidatus Aenigmarchaeota archaeon]|nr:hypothetical protein [Candidatus Aenigmarchaeota archaeon]
MDMKLTVPRIDALGMLKNNWHILALILIIYLGTTVRTLDYRWPYLRNIDSYNFYKEMDEILENGGVLPETDTLKLAPYGTKRGQNFYAYAGAYSYMFFRAFMPDMQLWQYLIWFPALLAALMAVPIYFITKTLYDKKAGIFAAAMIVFDIAIISRTLGGDPDNDAMVLLMPLVIISLYLLSHKIAESAGRLTTKLAAFSVLTGLSLVAWRFTWGGFWWVLWLITGFLLLKLVFKYVKSRNVRVLWNENKAAIQSYGIIMLTFFALAVPAFGPGVLANAVLGPLEFPAIKAEGGTFPNVYVSVAELQNPEGPRDIINRTGLPFFILLLSLAYLSYSYIARRKHLDTLVLLGIWFVGPFLATIVAIRFTILFSAPMAIGAGIFFSKILRMTTGEDSSLAD